MPQSLKKRIEGVFSLYRAVGFVWIASPGWTLMNGGILAVQGLLPLAALYVMKLLIDAVTRSLPLSDNSAVLNEIGVLVGAGIVVALLTAFCQLLSQYASEAQSLAVTDHVTGLIHEKSISADLSYYEDPSYLDTLRRAQEEGPFRPTRIVTGLSALFENIISLFAMCGLLFSFSLGLSGLMVVAVLPGILVRLRYADQNYRWQMDRTPAERRADYYGWILTGDRHAKELRVFDYGFLFLNRYRELKNSLRKEKLVIRKKRATADFLAQALATLIIFSAVFFIASKTLSHAITLGAMVMYFQAFQRGVGHLKTLLGSMADLYEDTLFISNLYGFLDLPPAITDPDSPFSFPNPLKKGISFEQVSFSYPSGRSPVIENLSFEIAPGEVVAVVGENGSGKSTLVKLILRLYDPVKGSIRVDGIDIRKLKRADLRKEIGVIFQDFVKYHLTVRENITIGNILNQENLTLTEAAAKKAAAHHLIEGLPSGYETVLGKWFENGEELSLGQWQKIALARAFFRDSQIMVLDEPTSSLDATTEYEVFSAFKSALQGRAALIISHRFSTVRMADRIVVLDQGKIVENGSHEALMAKRGLYAEWFLKQHAN